MGEQNLEGETISWAAVAHSYDHITHYVLSRSLAKSAGWLVCAQCSRHTVFSKSEVSDWISSPCSVCTEYIRAHGIQLLIKIGAWMSDNSVWGRIHATTLTELVPWSERTIEGSSGRPGNPWASRVIISYVQYDYEPLRNLMPDIYQGCFSWPGDRRLSIWMRCSVAKSHMSVRFEHVTLSSLTC